MKSLPSNWKSRRLVQLSAFVCVIPLLTDAAALGGERKFLVVLASSPKQFPNSDAAGIFAGLPTRNQIDRRYFDRVAGNSIQSFAEYWEEISYGDVTIRGETVGWIDLPWPFQPALINPSSHTENSRPPTGGDINDFGLRLHPGNFIDLNQTGEYEYGQGELFDAGLMSVIRDFDGDPENVNNGPFSPEGRDPDLSQGGLGARVPVYMPGERFIDVDADGRWDGLDELANLTDYDNDGIVDNRGSAIDLNADENFTAPTDCVYLPDSDNDGNPDCCPNGPNINPDTLRPYSRRECDRVPGRCTCPPGSCPATVWEGPDDMIIDCNGNLIHDPLEILADPSMDKLPLQGPTCNNNPDGIPDQCQFVNFNERCSDDQECTSLMCEAIPQALQIVRCEFDDVNQDRSIDVVEPYENFLRRWDPCLLDPDASSQNRIGSNPPAHWIKVYDPSSFAAGDRLTCFSENYSVDYGNPEYIRHNYPGDSARVEQQADGHRVYGRHDPLGRLPANVVCRCADTTPCFDLDLDRDGRIEPEESGLCDLGITSIYDAPDSFENEILVDGPGATSVGSSKMQVVGTSGSGSIPHATASPKPGTSSLDQPWYPRVWEDRYVSGCFDSQSSQVQAVECIAPAWPGNNINDPNTPIIVPYIDAQPNANADTRIRRYFQANRGGLDGRGNGWPGNVNVVFETGPVPEGFEEELPGAILPEEADADGSRFYDGPVEFDDMSSSKYHFAGDQWLGEITSPKLTWYGSSPRGVITYLDGIERYNPALTADADPDAPRRVPAIWGEDRGNHNPSRPQLARDGITIAAGPYATTVHGANGRDGGNQLLIEYLSWRNRGPALNNGVTWDLYYGAIYFPHPYAGFNSEMLGFRDYNLDGLIDQGEVRPAGSENYMADADRGTANTGTNTEYPWNRRRMMEDIVAILDDGVIDFDDYVDRNSKDALTCVNGGLAAFTRPDLFHFHPSLVEPTGAVSGIVLLPPGSAKVGDEGDDFPLSPSFYPIHNEDGLNSNHSALLPNAASPVLSWNLFFHDLVAPLDRSGEGEQSSILANALIDYAAHEYLHAWQGFPDLYDYDVFEPDGTEINCPIGRWDIMADGGLVHPTPILKESPCTQWIQSVDITTIVTPGVDKVITLPPAELVRDDSYYFLENDIFPGGFGPGGFNRPAERFYFWSASRGFDVNLPGAGVLIMHTDRGSNDDAIPPQQRTGGHFAYYIVQADGLDELTNCTPNGDAGDPWPGTSNNQEFSCLTNPSSAWNTGNACSGLTLTNFQLDNTGSAQVTVNWVPTTIPGFRFIDPPGGVSVGNPPNSRFSIRSEVSDLYGGTSIQYYAHTSPDLPVPPPDSARIGSPVRKNGPGLSEETFLWNVSNFPNGQYFLFAGLIPGSGSDGVEKASTVPRPGSGNKGNGLLAVRSVNTANRTARLETWRFECLNADGTEWRVFSTITQPQPDVGAPNQDPYPHATTGSDYTSRNNAITVRITAGTVPFSLGDTFAFTTTGITAPSRAVTVASGRISEGPTAFIQASPLSGDPPLMVTFDGRGSVDPNGEPLEYTWNFGDGSPAAQGGLQVHTYSQARTFTVVLRARNPRTTLFGETSVDIAVTNNSPSASFTASPTSGRAPLTVAFNATASADTETPTTGLIYQWEFGNGETANPQGIIGTQFASISHVYTRTALGQQCTSTNRCEFNVKLTVTDGGGKTDFATARILVGNTRPNAIITASPLIGASPLQVVFIGINSTDPDNDPVTIEWDFGDATPKVVLPRTGAPGATDGSVPHTYNIRTGETTSTYRATAVVRDDKGGITNWAGATITVSPSAAGTSEPRAIFTITPNPPVIDQPFTVDASGSFDRPTGGRISSYGWNWGDGTTPGTGVSATHTYTRRGTFNIVLTVVDGETPPNSSATTLAVIVAGGDDESTTVNRPPTATFTVSPTVAAVDQSVSFDARASRDPDNDVLTFAWTFGDGASANGSQTTHAYSETGTFTARLTVRDARNGSANFSRTVTVSPSGGNRAPVVSIGSGPRRGATPFSLTMDGRNSFDPDGDSLNFAWEIHDESGLLLSSAIGPVLVFDFDIEGLYTVELVIRDSNGAESRSGIQEIEVFDSEPPPAQPLDNGNDNGDGPGDNQNSADQRPAVACGLGMMPGLLMIIVGLCAMSIAPRRKP